MHAAAFETIAPDTPITALPLTLLQAPSRASPWILLAFALPPTIAALAPFYLIAAHAAQSTQIFMERPQHLLQVMSALVAWALLFGWPIARRTRRVSRRRDIIITNTHAMVSETGVLGTSNWSEPLHSYRGLAYHVRASLSGTRHELLLIHPNPARSLLLRTADRMSQHEIDATTYLLGCREIAPQVFYRNTETSRSPQFATITPQLPSTDASTGAMTAL